MVKGAKWRSPEYISSYMREYHKKNYEHIKQVQKSWSKSHPQSKTSNQQRRRSVIRNGNFTDDDWEMMMDQYEGKCLCCGSTDHVGRDHIVPISKGGKHEWENIQPLCTPCNRAKGAKSTDYRPK
jgi:5-methylcytosine-specific restriction endonuclease McrA